MDADPDLVTVAAFDTALEAATARACLEAEGIPVTVSDSELFTVDPALCLAAGRISLKVRREDAAVAQERLDAWRERRLAAAAEALENPEEDLDDETADCLACNARIPAYLERCPACGWSYA
jgi:hypothetical protein